MMSRRLAWFTQGIKDILHNLMVLLTKLYLLMIVGVLLGMGWVLFLYKSQVFTQLWAKLAVIIGVGVSTGIISRMVFTKNKVLMAWLSTVLAIIVCLWCLNWITEGQVGFSLFPSWPNSVNWDGIWQLLTGMGIAWVTVSAYKSAHIHTSPIPRPIFRRPAPDVSLKKTEEVKPARLHKQEVDLSISHPLAEAEPAPVEELAAKIKPVKPKAKTKAGLQIGKKNSLVKTGKKRTTPPALPPHRSRQASAAKAIKLVGEEEHRCPYCLTLVDPDDPAGVMVCPVCHTYHHKSCWDVTGNCQVPHIHEG